MVSADDARAGRIPCPGPYAFAVVVPTREEDGETAADWAASDHRSIEVYVTVNDRHFASTAEKLAAYRWAVGQLARVAVLVHHDLTWHEAGSRFREARHWCSSDPQRGRCGLDSNDRIDHPEWAASDGDPPYVEFDVPTARVKEWRARIERRVAEVLAADQQPAPNAQREHITATITEPTDTTTRSVQ